MTDKELAYVIEMDRLMRGDPLLVAVAEAILGFCNDCGHPVIKGLSHLEDTGCLGLEFHRAGEPSPVPKELRSTADSSEPG